MMWLWFGLCVVCESNEDEDEACVICACVYVCVVEDEACVQVIEDRAGHSW